MEEDKAMTILERFNKLREQSWYQFNDWEETFIDSIGKRLEAGIELSERQVLKLNEVYAKVYK